MRPADRARHVRKILREAYPQVNTQLEHKTPFQLLVATILSAQCTDKQVNAVTRRLFSKLSEPEDFARASLEAIEERIHSTGFFRNKARHIQDCARMLLEKNGGRVPATLEELVKLPGVGRKTANVVLGAAFGIPGMVVDTHVARVSRRIGLTGHTDPEKIESDLMGLVPRTEWNAFSLRLIRLGREICQARKPLCPICPVNPYCAYPNKTTQI